MNKKRSILHRNEVFYTIGAILIALGAYAAYVIEVRYKILANGILGIVVPYLVYLAFLSPKNMPDRLSELEDLEFPRGLIYWFYGFFWTMIMYWGVSLTLDLARSLLHQ